MIAKYNMNVEDNIAYAKRMVIDSIWREARLEGIDITFPDTEEIYDGRTVAGLTFEQTKAINNLKHSWSFVFETIDIPIDIGYIRHINALVGADRLIADAGTLRSHAVRIGGTEWTPQISTYDEVENIIARTLKISNPALAAINLFLDITRGQWFNDGNKRTAQLLANKILIQNGAGIFSIPVKRLPEFRIMLIDYYESGERDRISKFLNKVAIDGIALEKPDHVSLDAKIRSPLRSTNQL